MLILQTLNLEQYGPLQIYNSPYNGPYSGPYSPYTVPTIFTKRNVARSLRPSLAQAQASVPAHPTRSSVLSRPTHFQALPRGASPRTQPQTLPGLTSRPALRSRPTHVEALPSGARLRSQAQTAPQPNPAVSVAFASKKHKKLAGVKPYFCSRQ